MTKMKTDDSNMPGMIGALIGGFMIGAITITLGIMWGMNHIDQPNPTMVAEPRVVYRDKPVFIDEPVIPEEPPLVEAKPLECMAMNLYYEAGNQSRLGMAAVARVVINRVEHPFYPDTVCGVIKQGSLKDGKIYKTFIRDGETITVPSCQFSWYCDGKPDDVPRDVHNTEWQIAMAISREVLAHDKWRGIVDGATHYHADYVDPKWRYMKSMMPVTSIDNHIFYRWER